ncbi:alanine/glycine:cation symporter family protein [Orrella daihaiensis]|uniref:Sodium:alanine symporter family protein n=1 Tax=Orrella daihaiensis TaxID=2782176 RepID=A0ABY4AGI8_9BURK|nr:sodium:alanine symporter family protein [Orrella daihaiensis]UOD49299.1 sodium:alanine symporter family protein [Orrella daihaiensis]
MQDLTHWLNIIGGWVWGPVLLVLLVGTGVFYTVRLKGLQFHALPRALKLAFSKSPQSDAPGDISQFQALMTAMAGTIGTGNIAGVATAVVLGGPGAIFWMWLSALFGMATKYAEAYLAVYFRVRDRNGQMAGGPMYYLEKGLGLKSLAIMFAVCGMIAALGTGNSVQSNSVAQAVQNTFGVPGWISGVILTTITGLVLLGGIRSIARVASLIVPAMALLYLTGGLIIIVANYELVLPALSVILRDAWAADAVAGGAIGAVIRYGVARGVFSNEAGIGTAPIAAAAAKTNFPQDQALVSMTGTFLDTIIVCTITGLVLVMAGQFHDGVTGAALTSNSFETLLPGVGGWVVTIGLIFFAYSTILGWSYYGEKCAAYLLSEKAVVPYRFVYTGFVMLGTTISLDLVWALADVFNGLMAFPNLIGLLLLSGIVVHQRLPEPISVRE